MSSPGSITRWLQQLTAGDRTAVQPLWERYFRRLVGLARDRLGRMPRRSADEEDVALSAFDSFCRRAERGLFPRLDDRDNLWQLLGMIAARKAIALIRHEGAQGRDWRRAEALDDDRPEPLDSEPDPAEAAEVAEETGRLLRLLPDDQLRLIAVLKMQGHTNEEI